MSEDTEAGSEEQKKPVKEIVAVTEQGFFVHETGDTYDGFFEAKKKDHYLKMHGNGVYTTAEGDIYSGHWEADRLVGAETTISYTDGSKYEGPFGNWGYNGRGNYTFPDGTLLRSDFVDNCPHKDMAITDPNGHVWLGTAGTGYGWLKPWNHFYQALERRHDSKTSNQQQEKAVHPNHPK